MARTLIIVISENLLRRDENCGIDVIEYLL